MRKSSARITAATALGAVALISVPLAGAFAAEGDVPTVTIADKTVAKNSAIEFTGDGFVPGSTVNITVTDTDSPEDIDTTRTAQVDADEAGHIPDVNEYLTFFTDNDWYDEGAYSIELDSATDTLAPITDTFTVVPSVGKVAPNVDTVVEGGLLKLKVSDFPDENIEIYVTRRGSDAEVFRADEDATYAYNGPLGLVEQLIDGVLGDISLRVPLGTEAGPYAVVVKHTTPGTPATETTPATQDVVTYAKSALRITEAPVVPIDPDPVDPEPEPEPEPPKPDPVVPPVKPDPVKPPVVTPQPTTPNPPKTPTKPSNPGTGDTGSGDTDTPSAPAPQTPDLEVGGTGDDTLLADKKIEKVLPTQDESDPTPKTADEDLLEEVPGLTFSDEPESVTLTKQTPSSSSLGDFAPLALVLGAMMGLVAAAMFGLKKFAK